MRKNSSIMDFRRPSEVKQTNAGTSRLARIFSRRKKEDCDVPEDLAINVPRRPLSKCFSRSSNLSDQHKPRYSPSIAPSETNSRDLTDGSGSGINSSPQYTTIEPDSPNFLAMVRPEDPAVMSNMEILSRISFRDGYDGIDDEEKKPISAGTRTVYSDMIEAFAEALVKTRVTKSEICVTSHEMSCPPESAASQIDIKAAKTASAGPRPRLGTVLSRSLTNKSDIKPFSIQPTESRRASLYACKALPARPQSTKAHSPTKSKTRDERQPRVRRREITQAKVLVTSPQPLFSSARRGSCPAISNSPATNHAGIHTRLEPQSQTNVNHLLGLLLFLYWISAGRRFFDKDCVLKLAKPGSRCLSLEAVIVGFQTEFPLATLEVYMSNTSLQRNSIEGLYISLPYPDESFDVISALGLTMTVLAKDWPATLTELRRILKPGGRLELAATSTSWLNAGPAMKAQGSVYGHRLSRQGFLKDTLAALPDLVHEAKFVKVQAAHLAIPVKWGGRISHVWSKFYEPLRSYRETQNACAWSAEQQKCIDGEILSYRSSRGLLLLIASK